MFAYLEIKAEMQRDNDGGVGERARTSEAARQRLELQAWVAHQQRTG